jgi:hypothetical protein
MKPLLIRVADLKDQTGMLEPRPILYCDGCGSECSANKSDYCCCSPETAMWCMYCDQPFKLVTVGRRSEATMVKRTVYEEVEP